MAKTPFKMKGFSGFGNSPLRGGTEHAHNTDGSHKVSTGEKILGGISALGAFGPVAGGAALVALGGEAYKSGQKHSGGKINPNQKSIMEEGKKKTKSIWKK